MIKVIGVAGYARSGKDTICDFIRDELKEIAISSFRYALADPIKDQVNEIFGWDDRHGYGDLKEEVVEVIIGYETIESVIHNNLPSSSNTAGELCHVFCDILHKHGLIVFTAPFAGVLSVKASPRQMYQLWGTEFARNNISDTIWFDIASGVSESNQGTVMIVPDIRFTNEAEWINSNPNAVLIGVERPVNSDSIGSVHASERDIPDVINVADAAISNTGTLDNLRETTKVVLRCLMGSADG